MRFVVLIEYKFIEHSTTRLLTNIFVHYLGAKFAKSNCIVNWFTCRLDGERYLGIANRKSLSIYRAQTYSPIFCCKNITSKLIKKVFFCILLTRIYFGQLRNIICWFSLVVCLAFPIEFFYVFTKVCKFRNHKMILKCLTYD